MRVLLTTPFSHPEVRRGAERYVSELAWWLEHRGHEVGVVTSTSGPSSIQQRPGGGLTLAGHRRGGFGRGRLAVDDLLLSGVAVGSALRKLGGEGPWDVAQCHNFPDAAALRVAFSGRRRPPYVLWLPGTARRGSLGGRPIHRAAFRAAVKGAARVHALSEYAAATVRRELGVVAEPVAPGVRTDQYAGPKQAGLGEPIILCTASPDDARKRVSLLVESFPWILERCSSARLVLAPPRPSTVLDASIGRLDRRSAGRVEVRAGLALEELPELYRQASVSVLPSIEEAFGLVVVESLAAGTPVVGAASGAVPEILCGQDDVGALFTPDDRDSLVEAVQHALGLANAPSTVDACRRHAQRWDWDHVGPRLEQIYASVA